MNLIALDSEPPSGICGGKYDGRPFLRTNHLFLIHLTEYSMSF